MPWPEPSERVKELIRRGAEAALSGSEEWIAEVDAAAFSAADMRAVADDPELRAFVIRGTHANLIHWVTANVRKPGAPVPPNTEEPLDAARLLIRRGYNEASLDAYRLGQDVAWRHWLRIAFALTSDPDDLREMLEVTAQSISEFVGATVAATRAAIQKERDLLARTRDSEIREAVVRLVDGDAGDNQSTERTLGYRLAQEHTAAVVWTAEAVPRLTELETIADDLARHSGARETLRVVASPGTVWLWLAGADEVLLRDGHRALGRTSDVRVAIGSSGYGIDGFRVAHLDALSTQRTMARLDTDHLVGTFADVEGVLLLTADAERADRFVANNLGAFAHAAPGLREAVRVYLREQGNASRAAERLFTHRNTILRRLKRAEEALPRPLHENALNIAMALEILHWRGGAFPSP